MSLPTLADKHSTETQGKTNKQINHFFCLSSDSWGYNLISVPIIPLKALLWLCQQSPSRPMQKLSPSSILLFNQACVLSILFRKKMNFIPWPWFPFLQYWDCCLPCSPLNAAGLSLGFSTSSATSLGQREGSISLWRQKDSQPYLLSLASLLSCCWWALSIHKSHWIERSLWYVESLKKL